MGKFPVSQEKELSLTKRMHALGIEESDLVEKFIRGSGPGGQKINKTSSCVYLFHQKSGVDVKCQLTRSQSLNRFHARRELCEKVEEMLFKRESKKVQEREKIRRQKQRRTRKQKAKMLQEKRHRGEIKSGRGQIHRSGED